MSNLNKPLKEIIEQNPDVSLAEFLKSLLITNAEEIRGIMIRSMIEGAEKILREYQDPKKNIEALLKETETFREMEEKQDEFYNIHAQLFDRVRRLENLVGVDSSVPYYFQGIIRELEELKNIVDDVICDLEYLKEKR